MGQKSKEKVSSEREVQRRNREKDPKEVPRRSPKKIPNRGPKRSPKRSPKRNPKKEIRKDIKEVQAKTWKGGQPSATQTRGRIKCLRNRPKNPTPSTTVPHNYMLIHPRRSPLVYNYRPLVLYLFLGQRAQIPAPRRSHHPSALIIGLHLFLGHRNKIPTPRRSRHPSALIVGLQVGLLSSQRSEIPASH
ncbi:hypothetical protein BDV98DRAFT_568257 [Pterulicium gracile]|uniref:Uncharacterized protein n=1 Tax=Pterulicium gracile TaxID=1884261 RepID=A0A5C3QGX8_9AGAR|nr:hypothetical protein BDV98DRAFT_568257 [Pterula gracilis]